MRRSHPEYTPEQLAAAVDDFVALPHPNPARPAPHATGGALDPVSYTHREYYCKLPDDIAEREVIVLDPMLATGGSAVDAITQIKKRGAKSIKFIGIIAAPEGMQRLQEAHPDVDIYVAAMDEKLNENGYIVPGLGDAGDRIFGTK